MQESRGAEKAPEEISEEWGQGFRFLSNASESSQNMCLADRHICVRVYGLEVTAEGVQRYLAHK